MISTDQAENDATIPAKRVTIEDIIPLAENVSIQYSANKEPFDADHLD